MAQDVLADGYVKLCIDTSLNFYDGACRMLVEGQYFDGGEGIEPNTLTAVKTSRDIDTMFGAGSVLAEGLKAIFCTCPSNVEVFAIPREDPASSTAAVYTLTVTASGADSTVVSSGRLELFLMDARYSVDLFIEEGLTQDQVAAAILAALPDDFPYTATRATNVITLTAKSKGEVGNYLTAIQNWRGLSNYGPGGVTIVAAQTTVGTGTLQPLDYDAILGTCCYSCFALLSGSFDSQNGWQAYLEDKWNCDQPQCFGHGYTYVPGTLGTILARDTNAAVLSKLAHGQGDFGVPWLKTAAYAALSCCTACQNPELSIQGRNYGVLNCIQIPESCNEYFTYPERVQLQDAGFVVTGPLEGGAGAYTSPYIFNDVTNYKYDEEGRPNATFRDTNSRRLATTTAIAIATELQQYSALALFTKNTSIRQGIFGTNPRLMLADFRQWAKSQIGILFSEFDDIDNDISLKTDFEVAPRCQGNPGKLHLFFRYRPPTRLSNINTVIQPKLLDNCTR